MTHYSPIPGLDFHPCGQLVLLFEGLLQLALHLRPGVIVIQSGQERSQLPRVMLDGIQMVLILVVAGMVGGGALDLFIQFLFQLLVVLLCTPDVPVLGGVHGLPGHLCAAGKEDAAGGKADITMRMSKRKTPTITRTCALLLAAFASPFTAVLTAVLPFSTACSMPDRAADAPLDAALPPAVCAAVPERAAA